MENKISELSESIFWDTNIKEIDWENHKEFIVERVMTYGQLKDWGIIKKVYGLKNLKSIVLELRTLDDFSLSFLSAIFKIQKQEFRCYKLKQSSPNFLELLNGLMLIPEFENNKQPMPKMYKPIITAP